MTFPDLTGRDLDGRRRATPEDLPRGGALALVGMRQEQQADMDLWMAALPHVPILELVLLPHRLELARGWIEGGMARDIPDAAVRARTWCLYGDVDRALGELGAPGQDRILAAALRDGVVVASARGRPTPASLTAIAEALAEP